MQRIVFLDRGTIAPSTQLRRPAFDHEWIEHERTTPDEVAARLKGASIAITNKVPIRAEALAQLPQLKLIALAATGSDNVDVAACKERGIIVSNIRGYARETVPEHTFALILALRRSILPYVADVRAGVWQRSGQFCFHDHPVANLHGQALGLVGRGDIGGCVARIAEGFGMRVLHAARKGSDVVGPGQVAFETMLEQADVISLHCPLTAQTRNLLGPAEFARMQRRPLIINTARGGLIDDAALVNALRSGQIGGAGIDVCTPEPPPADHPLMQIVDLPNFIFTPHIGWAGAQAMQVLADQLIENVEAFVAGAPRNVL